MALSVETDGQQPANEDQGECRQRQRTAARTKEIKTRRTGQDAAAAGRHGLRRAGGRRVDPPEDRPPGRQKIASLERPRRRDDQDARAARTTDEGRDDIKVLMDGQEPPPRVAGLNPPAVGMHV
ncbi:hypothetical protein PR003_g28716 [Phytophthora rubi]|uniref:Uncharacterized protein n=1 Tax=Phytophthora rubi TaxID=129364 RepID=A0A6A4BXJ3_9STRA|nr:hypothetical protein PR001_g9427 [Phytophthora rubi]KAE9277702.1 hypothetical protein PR003_g28716 [Phytophthora rubi]